MQSLYVHFPFCESKCHYCDFYSLGRERVKDGDADRFEKALQTEASRASLVLSPVLKTIFLGGGTPSMTSCEAMERALEPLWKATSISPETEWTMECNPSSVSVESFRAYRRLGVNRVSMGVQVLRSDLLQALGRVHSRDDAIKALHAVFEAGFDNVSVDLLCGVPGQSQEDLEEAMSILTGFPITHLSCYLLTLAPHHRMYPKLPDEDVQLAHLLLIHERMVAKGFDHYEISNFAKPGKRAQHNLAYWNRNSYLGLGPSAHSYDAVSSRRWKNVSSLHKYANLLEKGETPVEWTETLTPQQMDLEKWMLSLRLDEGFPAAWLQTEAQRARAKTFEIKGILEPHPQNSLRLRLTAKGFALSDQVIRALA